MANRYFLLHEGKRFELRNFRLLEEGVPIHRQRTGKGDWEMVKHGPDRIRFEVDVVLPEQDDDFTVTGCPYTVETATGRTFQIDAATRYSDGRSLAYVYEVDIEHDEWRGP